MLLLGFAGLQEDPCSSPGIFPNVTVLLPSQVEEERKEIPKLYHNLCTIREILVHQ